MSFIQAILDGLLIGGVYAVISIGLTLVYGVMGIVNFAQAEFLTIGMFVAFVYWELRVHRGWPTPLALAVTLLVVAPAIGVLLCASKNDEVVEYALSRSLSPALIAEYQTQLPDKRLLQAKLHEFC